MARLPASVVQLLAHADALQLALGLGKQGAALRAVKAQHGFGRAAVAAQVRAQGDVFQHRHVRHHLHVLEGARDMPRCAILRAPRPLMRLAPEQHFPAGQRAARQ
jgi:hypothetical protein